MKFYLVQPWGRDRYRQATVQSIHATVDDAYARLDAIAEKLQRDGAPGLPGAVRGGRAAAAGDAAWCAVTFVLRTLADHRAFTLRAFCQACELRQIFLLDPGAHFRVDTLDQRERTVRT